MSTLLNLNDSNKEYYKTVMGNIVSVDDAIEDEVRDINVIIEPTQEGSGDPYPPGGGRNLLPLTLDNIKTYATGGSWNGNVYTYNGVTLTVNLDGGGNVTGITANGTTTAGIYFRLTSNLSLTPGTSYILSGTPSGGRNETYFIYTGSYTSTGWIDDDNHKYSREYNSEWTNLYIGIRANVTVNNLVFRPMIRLASDADDTFEPYSNIRPVTGVSSVTVTRTGNNLLPIEFKYQPSNEYAVYFANGGKRPINAMTLPPGTYTFSYGMAGDDAGPFSIIWNHTPDLNATEFSSQSFLPVGYSATFTLAQTEKVMIRIYRSAARVPIENVAWAQIERGSTATAYEVYQGQTVTVALVDGNSQTLTVYGGTLDVTTGELTVTHKVLDLGDYIWGKNTEPGHVYFIADVNKNSTLRNLYPYPPDNDTVAEAMLFCSDYKVTTYRRIYAMASDNTIGISTIGTIGVYDSSALEYTMEEFKSYASGKKVCMALATPVTYQLTPQQISTLLGTNNVYSGDGQVSLTYRFDPTNLEIPE